MADLVSDWKTALTAKHGDLKGPSEETAVCANCEDHTTGLKCEHCKIGYFQFQTNLALKVRGESKFTTHCLPCQCNGHGDICDEVSIIKSVSFKKTVEISSTHEICTEFTQLLIKTKQI